MLIFPFVLYVINLTKTTPNGLIANITSDPYDIVSFVAPISAAAIGAAITIIVYFFQRKQQRISAEYQKKQLNLSAMMEVFKILNNNEHRQARKNVYYAFEVYDKKINQSIFQIEPYGNDAAMVRADFDEIGLLIQNGLIPKNMFLSAYWNTVIISWKGLKDDIAKERIRRKYSMYMAFFEQLYQEAEDYAKENGIDTTNVKPYYDDELTSAPIE